MKINLRKPKSLIYHYCFLCVLIGCIEASLNAQMFEATKPEITPIRTITIKPRAEVTVTAEPAHFEAEGCPTKETVQGAISDCKTLINCTQKLIALIQNDADAEQRRLDKSIALWKNEARVWKIKNDSRIESCWFLLGATGYEVHPELPLALENLKRSGNWLDCAVEAAKEGKLKDANDYILAARKATKQAGKLVAGKIRPKSKYALVGLPRHLASRNPSKDTNGHI